MVQIPRSVCVESRLFKNTDRFEPGSDTENYHRTISLSIVALLIAVVIGGVTSCHKQTHKEIVEAADKLSVGDIGVELDESLKFMK